MSDTTVNWGKLVSEGRARAFGTPWTREERDELYIKKTATAAEIRARYEIKHVVTKKDLEANEGLEEQGVKEGDVVEIPTEDESPKKTKKTKK